MKRRSFLKGLTAAGAGAAISSVDWLRYFRSYGVPGTPKQLGMAEAHAQAAADPHFLIYWFLEGGVEGYDFFNPIETSNDATRVIPAGTLQPNPSWSAQRYRPSGYGTAPVNPPKVQGNITYGYLAQGGLELFPDLAVVSSHVGSTFHSGSRFEYHYGKYNRSLAAMRGPDERTVMQAFCEAYGADAVLPHVSWHRWLSDGELSLSSYPEGTGYYEKLGPAYAHTIYGGTPSEMRARIQSIAAISGAQQDARIRQFVDNLHDSFTKDKNSASVKAFAAAVAAHRKLAGSGASVDPATLFTDATLRAEFGVTAADEQTSATSVNGNPARSKGSPNTNVQALMAFELITKGLSVGCFIESREVRGFDDHRGRANVMSSRGLADQRAKVDRNLWTPLKALAKRLKTTPYGTSGKSYWDYTTIVICSEMGRAIEGNVDGILASTDSDESKYAQIMDQDVCQHWPVSGVAFLGGTVKGNTQFGRVGRETQEPIPVLPTGALDPAYDPVTGRLLAGATKSANSFVSDAGHVYATALYLSGLDPAALRAAGKGRNTSPPLTFLKR